MTEIFLIDSVTAESVIETRLPEGLFATFENNAVVGIDNRTGNAWTEPFQSFSDCVRWLEGEELDEAGALPEKQVMQKTTLV